jgi:hypothetical protein
MRLISAGFNASGKASHRAEQSPDGPVGTGYFVGTNDYIKGAGTFCKLEARDRSHCQGVSLLRCSPQGPATDALRLP